MTVAVLAMTALAILVIVIFRLAIRRVLQERERMRQAEIEHHQKLLYNSINTQERERKRIAADLHDELSSRLSILKLNLHKLAQDGDTIPEEVSTLVDDTLKLSRNIAHDLYPPLLAELGLAETLRDYLIPVQKQIDTELHIQQHNLTGATLALQLLRISQEIIQNVLKHARATRLSLYLRTSDRCTALLIRDDGIGFTPSETITGLGLGNIESRVQLLKGHYRIKSFPGRGTSTLIVIPHGKN